MTEAPVLLLVALLSGANVSHVEAIPFPTLQACEVALAPVANLAKKGQATSIAVQCREINGPDAALRGFRDEVNRIVEGFQP